MNEYRAINTEPGLWTVGFRIPYTETWETDSDHGSEGEAQSRADWLNGLGRGFVYRRTEPLLWTVGRYGSFKTWNPLADFADREEAAQSVAQRNGSDATSPVTVILDHLDG